MPNPARAPKTASLRHERHYYRLGCRYIFGMDEAGRGPLAGPVAAATVALPLARNDLSQALRGVRDSKEMSALQRESLDTKIKAVALAWGIGASSSAEIDRLGIVQATKAAMQAALEQALAQSDIQPDCLFLDYMLLPEARRLPQVSIVQGDKHSLSIACASVIAKVWRDNHMRELGALYPQYGFAKHKGYGTAAHCRAIEEHGPCPQHRHTFAPVRKLVTGASPSANPVEESGASQP